MNRHATAALAATVFVLVLAIGPAPVSAQGEPDPIPAQQVINHYIDLFNADWAIGQVYDPGVDGMGYTQSRDIPGSPSFTPHKRPPQFISAHMSISPVHSPDNAEGAIIDLIGKATKSLFIEQIYVNGFLNDILLAVKAAKDRGVDVRVIQDFSGYHEDGSNILASAGIPVRLLKSNSSIGSPFDSQHNKGVIVDGRYTLVCSINWSPTSIRQNREAGLIIDSTAVATYYTDLFMFDWERSVTYVPTGPGSLLVPGTPPGYTPVTFSGTMNVTCLAAPDNCFDPVNEILARATSTIDVSVYTLSSPYLIDTLHERIGAGVKVRLLLEKNQVSSAEKAYNRNALYNMTVLGSNGRTAAGLWASSSFTFQHSKYAIVDNATLIISSGNWGRASCPKPQDDGDVDGNRDWWFVVYGDGAYVPGGGGWLDLLLELGMFDPLLLGAVMVAGVAVVAWKTRRARAIAA